MKISRLILIALVISAYATVSVINIQLAKPKDVAEVTVDMLDVMSRAFDEGGEGGDGCLEIPFPHPYWATDYMIDGEPIHGTIVETDIGWTGWIMRLPLGATVTNTVATDAYVGTQYNCVSSPGNYCCQLDVRFEEAGGGGPD